MRIEVILQHGWALDSCIWQSWLPWLQAHDIAFKLGERGYFGLPVRTPTFSDGVAYRIIVAHSLGLHLIDESVLEQADAVMAINSFLRFHPFKPVEEKRSRRVIKTMRDKLTEAPNVVLKQFLENCYYPESSRLSIGWWAGDSSATGAGTPLCTINVPHLANDLQRLDEHMLSPSLLNGKTLVNVLGARDKIVPPGASSHMNEALPDAAAYCLDDCGHAAPMMQADTCLLLLADLVQRSSNSVRSRLFSPGSAAILAALDPCEAGWKPALPGEPWTL